MLDLDWMESVKARLKRKNQVLFSPKDDLLAPLALLLEGQDRRAAVDTRAQIYLDRLLYWQDHWRDWSGSWAAFLCR